MSAPFLIWNSIAGAATGRLMADALHSDKKDDNAKKPPGLMTKFKHAVAPMPKTPQERAHAVLHELTKLHPISQSTEEPDYPYIEKLIKKGLSGAPDKSLYRIGETLINAEKSDLAKLLISTTQDFPVNYAGGSREETLLHYAVLRGDFGVIRHLLDQGANAEAKTRDDNTPLDLATRRGFSPTATIISDMLTDYGARKTEPPTPEKIEEKWRADMREQIQDIIELDTPVSRPKTARFSKKPGSTV